MSAIPGQSRSCDPVRLQTRVSHEEATMLIDHDVHHPEEQSVLPTVVSIVSVALLVLLYASVIAI